MSAVYKRGRAKIEANLTPMIDVTFLLIVFFVLVSQIVEVENVPLELPTPVDPATMPPGEEQRAVINVLPAPAGRSSGYKLGGHTFPASGAGVEALAGHLVNLYRANPALRINLRADRATSYESVHPVLEGVSRAAARAGVPGLVPRVQLVVVKED
ncbi:MAG: ExbD/TolR family protein [Planctomycetota bacterium]|jgi:biopolymer transport protein ExbD